MATGANIQQGRSGTVSNITPGADFRTGEAEVWQEADRVFKTFERAARPNLLRRAAEMGAAEGTEAVRTGELSPMNPFASGEFAEARIQARQSSFLAGIRTDIDKREAEVRNDHRYDPEAYQAQIDRVVSTFIQGAPPEFAVDVETYARGKAQNGFASVAQARTQRDDAETVQGLATRAATLNETMIALAANGERDTPEYLAAQTEHAEIQTMRASNPAVLYSEDQRIADDDKLTDDIMIADVTRLAMEQYSDGGRGQPGFAAASRFLRTEVLEGEAFKDIDPGRLRRMHGEAVRQVTAFSQADREEQRAEAEAERARRAEQREIVGDLRLGILMGEVTEQQIMERTDIDETAKAGLVRGVRTEQTRRTTEQRTAAALETQGRVAVYTALRDDAAAGTLSNAEIADQLNAGLITPGQAVTLRTQTDRTLRPIIDGVMAPVRDAADRPGRRGTAVQQSQAEAHAANWARANPNATLQEQIEFGRVIADTVYGGSSRGGASSQGGAAGSVQARLSALAAERTRTNMPVAEYNRRRREIMND